LYSLGFVTGALTSLFTGPLVDKFGRKTSAVLYCVLEIGINMLEQYPLLAGLIVSRMVSGVTNNLLSCVFESWLDTEYRRLGFDEDKFELIMRDSVVLSNLAAIGSGYLSHILAERYGPVGPFQGAVAFTTLALVVVMGVWAENFGSHQNAVKTTVCYLKDAYATFRSDSRILRVGIIQGLTMGAVQIFVFLWSPALRQFARSASQNNMGLDRHGDPAYGLIFGAFMFSGVFGGLVAPLTRKTVTVILSPLTRKRLQPVVVPGVGQVRPMAVEFLAAFCYMICAILLFTPCLLPVDSPNSFSLSLGAFLMYEFVVGLYLPCEGVIRSLYIPADARATMMTLPRIIVNIAVAVGVVSTNFVS
jgi:MFS family permease